MLDVDAYGATMAEIEAELRLSVKLEFLTCSACGNGLGIWNGREGYDTKAYKRWDSGRLCMRCDAVEKLEKIYKVDEERWVLCLKCDNFVRWGHAIRASELSSMISGRLLRRVLHDLDADAAESAEDAEFMSKYWVCRKSLGDLVSENLVSMRFKHIGFVSDDNADMEDEVGNEEV